MAKGKLSGRGMTRQEFETKQSWIVDTAETPKDQKNLKKDLKKVEKEYNSRTPVTNHQPRIGGHSN